MAEDISAQGFAGTGEGGFVTSAPTQEQTTPKKPQQDSRTLLPVTIRQILNADIGPEGVRIDGVEVQTLVIVGKVANIEETSSFLQYTFDDGTGLLPCQIYGDKSVAFLPGQEEEISEGSYVKCYGRYKVMRNEYMFFPSRIMLVEDFNEVTYHILSVIRKHLYNTTEKKTPEQEQDEAAQLVQKYEEEAQAFKQRKGLEQGGESGGYGAGPSMQQPQQGMYGQNQYAGYQDFSGSGQYGGYDPQGGYGNANYMQDMGMNLDSDQQQVMNVLRQYGSSVHVNDVYQQCPNLNQHTIDNILNDMLRNGLVYNTEDSYHYALANADM
eukprot:gb/GECH01001016.1/.p1 GENE.gb/GECH01001016.1/~~gb/GECH01001016.1/.p1  ORF type:complete len:325 (+),score=108.91 gb/GECH01001016.1/:1-975(+)